MLKNAALPMRFVRKKSSIERLHIAQIGSYYVRGVGLPFIHSSKDLGILAVTELECHGQIRFILGEVLECR